MTVAIRRFSRGHMVVVTCIPVIDERRAQNLISIPHPHGEMKALSLITMVVDDGGDAAAAAAHCQPTATRGMTLTPGAEGTRLPRSKQSGGSGNLPRPAGRPELPGSRWR